jgi:hypothetical protein
MELRHLEEAKERGAGIFDIGDLFDAMQGQHDRRRCYDDLRPELRGADYINKLIDYNASFLKPYKDLFVAISPGNHETAIRQHQNIDLTSILANRLGCAMLPYEGYTRFFVSSGTSRTSIIKYHHHGWGYGRRSKGILTVDLISAERPDADIVHTGHTHTNFVTELARERVTASGHVVNSTCWHVRTAGYKPASQTGSGWAVERGHGPCALGAAWLRIIVDRAKAFSVRAEVLPAR